MKRAQISKSFGLEFDSQHCSCSLGDLAEFQTPEARVFSSADWRQHQGLAVSGCFLRAGRRAESFMGFHRVLTITQWGGFLCLHFTGEEHEIQRSSATSLGSHSQSMEEAGLRLWQLGFGVRVLGIYEVRPRGPRNRWCCSDTQYVSSSFPFDFYSHSDI